MSTERGMNGNVIADDGGSDPEDAAYERNVTIAMLRRSWGKDTTKWPDEERAWLAKEES